MALLTETIFQRRARWAYELGRARLAAWQTIPVIVLSVIAWAVSPQASTIFALAAALAVLNSLAVWRGLDFGLGARVGLVAGAIPLFVSLGARYLGHMCTPAGCMSWCVPACAAGGTMAAVVVALSAKAATDRLSYWASASLVATLTGSLACGCVGPYGIATLLAAFVLSSLPASYVVSKA
jgi:hypothetical protein